MQLCAKLLILSLCNYHERYFHLSFDFVANFVLHLGLSRAGLANDDFPSTYMNLPAQHQATIIVTAFVIKELFFCFYKYHEELKWNCEVVLDRKILSCRELEH